MPRPGRPGRPGCSRKGRGRGRPVVGWGVVSGPLVPVADAAPCPRGSGAVGWSSRSVSRRGHRGGGAASAVPRRRAGPHGRRSARCRESGRRPGAARGHQPGNPRTGNPRTGNPRAGSHRAGSAGSGSGRRSLRSRRGPRPVPRPGRHARPHRPHAAPGWRRRTLRRAPSSRPARPRTRGQAPPGAKGCGCPHAAAPADRSGPPDEPRNRHPLRGPHPTGNPCGATSRDGGGTPRETSQSATASPHAAG